MVCYKGNIRSRKMGGSWVGNTTLLDDMPKNAAKENLEWLIDNTHLISNALSIWVSPSCRSMFVVSVVTLSRSQAESIEKDFEMPLTRNINDIKTSSQVCALHVGKETLANIG